MQEDIDKVKTTVVKPIVFGNISRYLGKKREEDGRTHQWTAFLRPLDPHEDMSTYVRRVQFKLHDSYSNPVRIFNKPPYELTETGWGEFEIVIKVSSWHVFLIRVIVCNPLYINIHYGFFGHLILALPENCIRR